MLNRRSFLRLSSLAALTLPSGAVFAEDTSRTFAWGKPKPAFPPNEAWPNEVWESAYRPDEFVFVKPTAQLVGDHAVALTWKTQEIAYGWAEVSQDGGATWTKVWSERDGIRDVNTCSHCALVENYDMTKPLKFRAVSRPIAEYSCWGNVRFQGETLPEDALSGYFINVKAYKALVMQRAEKYAGIEYVEEGELPARDPNNFRIVMFNDVHHSITMYPRLLDALGEKQIDLAIFAGDICDHARSPQDFDKHLVAPMAYLTQRCGAMTRFVRGNHETMGLYAGKVRDHVALQDHNFYGAVTVGDTRLLFLDTGNDGGKDDANAVTQNFYGMQHYFAQEGAWLKGEVASAAWRDAKKRVSFSHIPPTYVWHKGGAWMMENLYAPLENSGLTLHCAGHIHYWGLDNQQPHRPYPLLVGGGMSDKARTIKGKKLKDGTQEPDRIDEHGVLTASLLTLKPGGVAIRQVNILGHETIKEEIKA